MEATQAQSVNQPGHKETEAKVKCLVWDLDHTMWNGVLLEDGEVELRENVLQVVRTLDERGILQSIASKNDHEHAMTVLKQLGIDEYFLYPQIHWSSKSSSIRKIAELINIGLDTIAFVDDQAFEREEVEFELPQVRCISADDIEHLLERADMTPLFLTEDSKLRRKMYMTDIIRKEVEDQFQGPQEEFLATLDMRFTISRVGADDLKRAEELTVRTHQLNTTGYTYSYDELDAFSRSDRHLLFISGLEDKYGQYGKIGLTLVECGEEEWTLKLLLMSCRVMSRGVGSIMLNYVMQEAKKANCKLCAEFVANQRNRMMYVTYRFAGFEEVEVNGEVTILRNNLDNVQPFPDYVNVRVID
ncbi:HAD-IIIC family phosphatase [Paenibacillus sp. sgz5001063]|uniref:HAD-IIIC family phosphatase n=1 Tax=Paenibacillus sp. sgz5001063 TaxID=3242474 RepID=UPI0036D29497